MDKIKEIDKIRMELYKVISHGNDNAILETSQRLDKLLVEYYKSEYEI